MFDQTSRVQKLKKTPIYVKPQLTSDSRNCHVSVMVGIRNDPGKPIDSITRQFQLPPLIVSADLTANYGTVDILADKVSLLPTISSTVTPLIPDLVTGQGKGSIVGSFRKFSKKLSTLHVPGYAGRLRGRQAGHAPGERRGVRGHGVGGSGLRERARGGGRGRA
jgi:hypothetical protein